MKEASAELNMTVVTIVAIAAVGAFFYLFIWPNIQRGIATTTCENSYSCTEDITVVENAAGGFDCMCGSSNLSDGSKG